MNTCKILKTLFPVSISADSSITHSSFLVFETMAKTSFKLKHPLERRIADIAHIRGRYPDRIRVVIEKAESSDIPDIDMQKYIVPADLTLDPFVRLFRIRMKMAFFT